jgi:dolichyl-phosphate-mannose-protein mannosyltransferase
MQLVKRDLVTIAVLAVIFFSVASLNLGLTQAPLTTWQTTENKSFYIDLGEYESVNSVYLLVQRGNVTVNVYTGSPGNWSKGGESVIQAYNIYYNWKKIDVNSNTQFVRLDIQPEIYDSRPQFYWSVPNPSDALPSPFIEIVEIAILNQNNQTATIKTITSENGSDSTLSKLVDEQALVQCPPTCLSETYFDEFYFIRAAQNYLNSQPPYERTHPPLGKLILACGLSVFGSSPFGLRITGVLFATLMIAVMYLLGKKLFGTWIGAFASAFLLTFDFMHFTMGRMGTVDTYVVFFSLLSQLCFLTYFMNVVKKGWKTSVLPLFLAVMFFAFGFSTKWLSLYGAVGMIVLLAALRFKDVVKLKEGIGAKFAAFFDHPFLLLLGFIAVAIGIYFAMYIPDLIAGNTLPSIIKLQFEMYNFHSTSTATHTFQSPWWSWPLIFSTSGYVPLYLYGASLPNGMKSSIAVLGNPVAWWVGFACMIAVAERAVRGKELVQDLWRRVTKKRQTSKTNLLVSSGTSDGETQQEKITPQAAGNTRRGWDLAAVFIAVVFFFSWVPYALISRSTFIYHFYISVPFLCLASAYFINKYWNTKWGKIAAIAFFTSVVVSFGLFYPVLSGSPASTSWIDKLKLFPSWYF